MMIKALDALLDLLKRLGIRFEIPSSLKRHEFILRYLRLRAERDAAKSPQDPPGPTPSSPSVRSDKTHP